MKSKILYLIISLFATALVSAAGIGVHTRQAVGRTLTRIVAREEGSGYVKVQAGKAARRSVRT